ncbi:MAG TPA: ATP-binding protein [Methylomirabilota bacterium]|jgi:signal transduction histidine kinase|nr:ATP-binding protein [Methylomirabilota bacterium]
MSVTGFEGVAVTLIVAETALLLWLLWHRALGSGAQRRLNERLRFETLLSGLSASLVHVESSGLDAALGGALRQLVVFLGVDRGNLDEYVEGAPGVRVSWAEPGIEKLPSILEAGHFVWTADTLRRGGVVRFPRTDALPPAAAADRASYERLGTRSHLSIPLQAGGPMLGVLSFDSVRVERDWPDDLVDRLRLLSEAFAGALERKRMEQALSERLRFQRLLSDLSAGFSNLSALDFDHAVDGALRSINDFLGVDRAALIEFPTRTGGGRSWTIDGATDTTRFPWLMHRLRQGDLVRVSRLDELPDEADADRRSGLALGVKSLAALPLRAGGVVLGGLVLATVFAERRWRDELIEQLHLVAETVANALAGAQAEREAGRLRQELAHIGRVSAMGELTASLAHELNQPLTAILNNAEVAQQHLDIVPANLEELREILADIVADDKRAAEVIRRLRALVQKGTLEHVPLDINDVVSEVAQLVRNDVVLRNVPMTVDLASGLPSVRGDRVQLQQVVLNMVLNGLEAMVEPDGGDRALLIRTSRAGDAAIRVEVEDAGAGLDMRDADRIFQPLYTTKPAGLGMGLAIARTIIDAHGGRLHGANNVGAGATFQFTLPVTAEPAS